MHNNTTYVVNPCKSDEKPNTNKHLSKLYFYFKVASLALSNI